MNTKFSNVRKSTLLGENRPLQWWQLDVGMRQRSSQSAGNAFKLKRTRLMPKDVREDPQWWPALRTVIVVLSLVMPILTIRYGEDWKKGYQQWRSNRVATQMVVDAEAGDPDELVGKLLPALEQHPKQPEVLRKLAWATLVDYPQQAETLFRRLQDLGHASLEDEMQLSRLMVAEGNMDQAEALLASLMQAYPKAAQPWVEYGRVAMVGADSIKAQSAFHEALKLDPKSVEAQLELTTLLVESTEAEAREKAMDGLMDLCEQQSKAGATEQALLLARRFLTLDAATAAQKQRFVRWVDAQGAVVPVEMQMASVAMQAPAFLDEKAVTSMHQQWRVMLAKSAVDESRFIAALRWLQARSEHALVLDQTDLPELTRNGELMTVRLVSLVASGGYDAAAALASHPQAATIGVHPHLLEALEAYRVSPTKEHLEGTLARLLAGLERTPHAPSAFVMGGIAAHVGSNEVAMDAFCTALQIEPSWPVAAQPFLDAVRRSGRSAPEALSALMDAPRRGIASIELRKRMAYLRLLSGERVVSTEAQVKNLLTVSPGDPYLRMLAALARHQQGDASGAMSYLVPLPQNRWHHGEAAVIASILASGGDLDRPLQMIATLRSEGMMEEERAQMQPWLAMAQAVAAQEPVIVPLARNP